MDPRLIVPTVEQGVLDAALVPSTRMTYHGGRVLANVEVFTIFWGAEWEGADLAPLTGRLNDFFDAILTSSLIDLLAEYSVEGQTIGHGTRIGSATIVDAEPGDEAGSVSDDEIRTALQGWIDRGSIPEPTANTLYFVYLRPGVTSTLGRQGSCTAYCGYHNVSGDVYYAVEPYLDCPGCDFTRASTVDNLTVVSSHELCEAVTDPALDGWYDDVSGAEIGDVCNGPSDVRQLDGWYVQTEWSNVQGACALGPAPA
jgi:hypothetical protein